MQRAMSDIERKLDVEDVPGWRKQLPEQDVGVGMEDKLDERAP
jgi:hypothetical protein